jgi:hypothetical protein
MASPFGREKCHWHFSFIGLTPVGSAPASLLATVSETNARHVSARVGVYGAAVVRKTFFNNLLKAEISTDPSLDFLLLRIALADTRHGYAVRNNSWPMSGATQVVSAKK